MDIWAACKDALAPACLEGELVRVVESQEQVATNRLVDNLDEQALLEEMLETCKPPAPVDTADFHYLLSTPFRYPPLPHGSRFGGRNERGIFYASLHPGTALAETAYYRFLFWTGMIETPPRRKFTSEHTLFAAPFFAKQGLRLHEEPFLSFKTDLVNPNSYSETQQLGKAMREAGVGAFEYTSARDPDAGINIALFSPAILASKEPNWQKPLLCETRNEKVSFYSKELGTLVFPYEKFLVEGIFPAPGV